MPTGQDRKERAVYTNGAEALLIRKGIQDKSRLSFISCYWNFPKQKPICSLPATYCTLCQPSEMQILAFYAGITSFKNILTNVHAHWHKHTEWSALLGYLKFLEYFLLVLEKSMYCRYTLYHFEVCFYWEPISSSFSLVNINACACRCMGIGWGCRLCLILWFRTGTLFCKLLLFTAPPHQGIFC